MVQKELPPDQDPCPTCKMGPEEMADYLRTLGYDVTSPALTPPSSTRERALRFLCADLRSSDEMMALWPGLRFTRGFWHATKTFKIRWMWELLTLQDNPFKAPGFGAKTHGRVQQLAESFGLPYNGHHETELRRGPNPDHPLIVEAQRRRPIGS